MPVCTRSLRWRCAACRRGRRNETVLLGLPDFIHARTHSRRDLITLHAQRHKTEQWLYSTTLSLLATIRNTSTQRVVRSKNPVSEYPSSFTTEVTCTKALVKRELYGSSEGSRSITATKYIEISTDGTRMSVSALNLSLTVHATRNSTRRV